MNRLTTEPTLSFDFDSQIKQADCIDYLKTLESESVDLVLTDPPYAIGYDGGRGWDSQWDSEESYLDWCAQWTEECIRVLKPGGMLIVWGTLKTDTFLKYKLFLSGRAELVPQTEIIWSYNWGGRTKSNFARKHEYAWCYSKGKSFTFNGYDVRIERKLKNSFRTGAPHTRGTIPTAVWERNNHTTSKDFVGWHPTAKNIELLQRMILAYTNPGERVLDVFLGSGNTAIAALRSGRLPQGCELDGEEYFPKMRARIEAELEQLKANPTSQI